MIGDAFLGEKRIFLIILLKNKQSSSTLSLSSTIPPLIELQQTDSTNNRAIELIRAGKIEHGQGILAFEQTEGRGQRNKNWYSEAGSGLYLSICLQPPFLPPAMGFQLLAATVVAAVNTLTTFTSESFQIKWPNDLYWKGRKAGGILIQSVCKGNIWEWAVVGIGINVLQDQFPSGLPNPVSLYQICGKKISVSELAETMTQEICKAVEKLRVEGFDFYYSEYQRLLYKKGLPIELIKDGENLPTILHSVNAEGLLLTGVKGEISYRFGEVEWVF